MDFLAVIKSEMRNMLTNTGCTNFIYYRGRLRKAACAQWQRMTSISHLSFSYLQLSDRWWDIEIEMKLSVEKVIFSIFTKKYSITDKNLKTVMRMMLSTRQYRTIHSILVIFISYLLFSIVPSIPIFELLWIDGKKTVTITLIDGMQQPQGPWIQIFD